MENVTARRRERQESVTGCVVCVRCDGKGDNDTAVMNAVEKMKINEPHGLAMCSRIYARDETANEDQTVDFHGDGAEWRGFLKRSKNAGIGVKMRRRYERFESGAFRKSWKLGRIKF